MLRTKQQALPWKFLLTVFFILTVVTTAIPVINIIHRPAGTLYTGYTYESVGDIFFYLNLIEQAKKGNVLFQNFMTPEQHPAVFFHPLFLFLGWLVRAAHIGGLTAWHIARIILLLPLLVVLYTFLAKIFAHEHQRRFALLFTLCSGGILLATHESSLFVSLLFSPLSILTTLDSWVFFLLFLRHYRNGLRVGTSICMIALGLLQAIIHPYALLLWGVIPLAYLFVNVLLHKIRPLFAAQQSLPVIVALFAGYGYLLFFVLSNPVLRAWSNGAAIYSWPWIYVWLFFGTLLPLALIGIFAHRNEFLHSDSHQFLLLWLLVNLSLARSSYPYAGRVMILLFLPLGVCASYGAVWIWQKTRYNAIARQALPFLLALTLSNNLFHLFADITGAYDGAEQRYIDQQDVRVTTWLRGQGKPSDVVLAAPSWDTLFGQLAFHQVFITYGGLTNQFYQRLPQALNVYAGHYNVDDLFALVKENSIRYVVVGPRERNSGYIEAIKFRKSVWKTQYAFNFHPERYSFLHMAYNEGGYAVYEVSDTTRR